MSVAVTCSQCGASFRRTPATARTINLFCSKRCNALFHAAKRQIKTAEQFWAKVDVGSPEKCWPWTAYQFRGGYGQTAWKGKVWLAHRVALSLVDGDWESRLNVCHSCDNPPCCNPAHLWRGTHYDNQRDMIVKGRARHPGRKGELAYQAKLTAQQVADVRASREAPAVLADRYNVSPGYISSLRSRGSRAWADIPVAPKIPRTHCHNGHEYTGKCNVRGVRICMICHSERNAVYRQKRRENHTP